MNASSARLVPKDGIITFARLPAVPPDVLVKQMNDPRVTGHLPLLSEAWTVETARAFIVNKEAYWERDGLGHWAIFAGDRFLGWGGFQREQEDWDFGLVLCADAMGLGVRITKQALAFGRSDPRIDRATCLLPPSRQNTGALFRYGAQFVEETEYNGTVFWKYEIDLSGP